MALEFTTSYIQDSLAVLRYYKKLAERAIEQVTDDQLFGTLDHERQLHRDCREAHGRQYALALDGLSDHRWRKA